MMIKTEIGTIMIEAAYQSEEHAQMDGYDYVFTSKEIGRDIYEKFDSKGNRTYAMIDGFC